MSLEAATFEAKKKEMEKTLVLGKGSRAHFSGWGPKSPSKRRVFVDMCDTSGTPIERLDHFKGDSLGNTEKGNLKLFLQMSSFDSTLFPGKSTRKW